MESSLTENWRNVLVTTYEQILQQLILFTPRLLGALILLLIGWLVALLLAKAARSSIDLINRLIRRLFPSLIARHDVHLHTSYANVVSKIVFWLVLLFFIAAGANSLGLDIFSRWMGQLLVYLPRFAAGLLIMIGGYLVSNVVKLMAVSAVESAKFPQADLLGRSVQLAIFFTALVIGIEQLGINIQFFTQFFIVIAAVLAAGFSLAFGIGARDLIANIIGAQQANKYCRVGDEICIDGVEGILIEISSTSLVLEAAEGRVTVPARLFMEKTTKINSSTQRPAA